MHSMGKRGITGRPALDMNGRRECIWRASDTVSWNIITAAGRVRLTLLQETGNTLYSVR